MRGGFILITTKRRQEVGATSDRQLSNMGLRRGFADHQNKKTGRGGEFLGPTPFLSARRERSIENYQKKRG